MVQHKLAFLVVAGLIALAHSAPTEPESTTVSASSAPTTTTSEAPATSPAAPLSTDSSVESSTSTSAPATEAKDSTSNTTASMAVAAANEQTVKLNSTNFTCYGRDVGYYADTHLECKVYHFCLPGDYNGEPVFQRISYLCLNETMFDQQALDCVQSDKLTAPCAESMKFYEESNKVLRQAIVKQGDKNSLVSSGSTETPQA